METVAEIKRGTHLRPNQLNPTDENSTCRIAPTAVVTTKQKLIFNVYFGTKCTAA
jgi:hypothetical protein